MKKSLSIYIHIPFCKSKCNYCSFVSFCHQKFDEYCDYLIKEIEYYGKRYCNCSVSTIYIGGGTPSILPINVIERILKSISKNFVINGDVEYSIECNPESISQEKLKLYAKNGVNRLSIGLQSGNDKILKAIGRIHTKSDFNRAITLAKKYFKNINVDLMIGLPYQSIDDIENDIDNLSKLGVTHISCYALIIEENTKMFERFQTNPNDFPSEEQQVRFYETAYKTLKKFGYQRYEVSNFALKNFECKHNLCYWNNGNYIGLGVSAHSYIDGVRYSNFENYKEYCKSIKLGKMPVEQEHLLSLKEKEEEFVMLSLRTKKGINLSTYKEYFKNDILDKRKDEIAILSAKGLIKVCSGHLRATNKGFFVLNQIILLLI